jgi:hypothetical protein
MQIMEDLPAPQPAQQPTNNPTPGVIAMPSSYYEASDPAEAFQKASRDLATWNYDFGTLEAFQAMAAIRDGSAFIPRIGTDPLCACRLGHLRISRKPNGFAIAVVTITGPESGIADPAAAEVLDLHRYRRGQAFHSEQLLIYSQPVDTIEQLDAAYALLEEALLIERGQGMVTVTWDGEEYERPIYVLNGWKWGTRSA